MGFWPNTRIVVHKDDNSSVFVRFPNLGNDPLIAVTNGYGIQIDDMASPEGNPTHQSGPIYDFAAPRKIAPRPVG
jgi:hypothetical protein